VEILKQGLSQRRIWGADLVSTFVSVGNATQSFSRLLHAVVQMAHTLPQPVIVQHGKTPFESSGCNCIPFMGMEEFEREIKKADLLILHAGAGAILHALSCGKKPVVMPRRSHYNEHVDDHQLEFARALAAADKVILAQEPSDLEKAVVSALLFRDMEKAVRNEPMMVSLVRTALRERKAT